MAREARSPEFLEGLEDGKNCRPPRMPPTRTMRESFFSGIKETPESIKRTHDWHEYMQGWKIGIEYPRGVLAE